MKIVPPGFEIFTKIDGPEILKHIERVGRVCYKSEDKITQDSAEKFVASLIKRGHESVIEHFSITVKFIVDRGVSHELVRHRIASFAQESTRYCNYSQDKFGEEITVVKPCFWAEDSDQMKDWKSAMRMSEAHYFQLLAQGASPQEARSTLPNSLKTEVIMTTNLREWRHFFKLRTDTAAHPQMREVAVPLLREFQRRIPVVFDDIKIPEESKEDKV